MKCSRLNLPSVLGRFIPVLAAFFIISPDLRGLDIQAYRTLRQARHEHWNVRIPVRPAPGQGAIRRLDLVFAGTKDGTGADRILWDDSGLRLLRTSNGRERTLVEVARPISTEFPRGGELLLKRRAHWLEIVADRKRVLRVLDDGKGKGWIALKPDPAILLPQADQVRYQRVEPFVFGDDFMRTEEETKDFGVWKPVRGQWKLYSVMEEIEQNPEARIREGHVPDAEHSVNPFCLSGCVGKDQEAIILTGYPFWDDYRAGVSVKTTGGWMGLVFGAVDADNCWILRWRVAGVGVRVGRIELLRRRDGRDEILAARGAAGRTDSWYRLEVRAVGSAITAFLDESPVFEVRDDSFIGGLVGLYAVSERETFFDDVSVGTVPEVRFDHAAAFLRGFEPVEGDWKHSGADGRMVIAARSAGFAHTGACLLGSASWKPGWIQCDVAPGRRDGAVGVGAGISGDRGWRSMVVCKDRVPVEVRLERRSGKEWREVVTAPASGLGSGARFHLAFNADPSGVLKVYLGDRLVIRYRTESVLPGKFGLFCSGAPEVEFRQVAVWAPLVRDWEHPVDKSLFVEDPYMQGWASPRWAWIPLTPNAAGLRRYRHKGDFYGAFQISVPISHDVALLFGRDEVAPDQGYRVQARLDDDRKQGTILLERQGKRVASGRFRLKRRVVLPGERIVDEKIGALPPAPDTVAYGRMNVCREGVYIWVEVEGRELFSWRDSEPLQGRAVGLEVVEPLDLGQVQVHRDHVRDYQFERVAVDWLKIGKWEVTNRFACDPRWSHMNGRSKGLAALWNKFEYEGDFTVEFFAGMRMRQGDMREAIGRIYYPRVGDINLAFCARDRDLFSGYNLIIAAWDPAWSERWTRLLRRDKIVQQTDRELIPRNRDKNPTARAIQVDWDPGGRPIHGAWYYIKLRKTGPRFDFFFDNVPIFSWTDPAPLKGRQIALWTQHNSIVVARVKISYSHTTRGGAVLTAAPPEDQPPLRAESTPLRLESDSHWGRLFTFDRGAENWTPLNGDQSAEVRIVTDPARGANSVLQLTNLYAGGDFGVRLPVRGVDLGRLAPIEMDCAVPPGVKVNLYVRLAEEPLRTFFVTLTGPDAEELYLTRLGRFEGAAADGAWHHVRFDLAAALRRVLPGRDRFTADEIVFGMLHEGYLNAGLGGNKEGASWRLDNVLLAAVGPMEARFRVVGSNGKPVQTARILARRSAAPDGKASGTVTSDDSGLLRFPERGMWFVTARARNGDSSDAAPVMPVFADIPLAVAKTEPEDGASWGGGAIRIQFTKGARTPLAWQGLELSAGGTSLRIDPTTAAYDLASQTLVVDPVGSPVKFENAAPVRFVLGYGDLLTAQPTASPEAVRPELPAPKNAGRFVRQKDERKLVEKLQRTAEEKGKEDGKSPGTAPSRKRYEFQWTARMNYADDKRPPCLVRLTAPTMPIFDFNDGPAESVSAYTSSRYTTIRYVPRNTSIRDYALRVENRICGSDAAVRFQIPQTSVGARPVLCFDYRIDEQVRGDFLFLTRAGAYVLGFTDTDTNHPRMGEVPDVVPDGAWHHAEIDVARLLARVNARFDPQRFVLRRFAFGDWGYAAMPPGTAYELDNIVFAPVVSTSGSGLRVAWTCTDPSGIAGYSYAWGNAPTVPVDETVDTTATEMVARNLEEGDHWFRIRACDGAGNWGPISTWRFRVDNTPPAVAEVFPAKGEGAASPVIRIRFSEDLGQIDASRLTLTMNGERCALSPAYTDWDAEKRELRWEWVRNSRAVTKVIPDGAPMTFCLEGVRDFAGNTAPPFEWTWRIDYSKDHEGPPPPRIYCFTGRVLRFDDFSEGTGWWRGYGGERFGVEIGTTRDDVTKDQCLVVRKRRKGRVFAAYGYAGRLDVNEYPYIFFDVRIPRGIKVNLILHVEGEWRAVRMTGDDNLPVLGRIEDVKDDGTWHHVWLDLRKLLQNAFPDEKEFRIRYVALGDWSVGGNPVGARFYVDNFGIVGDSGPVPDIYVTASDPTGIAGYAVALDHDPRTVPEPKETEHANSRRPNLPLPTGPGLWFIHARARDGAGNWGRPAHTPYYCKTPMLAGLGDGLESSGRWRVTAARGGSGGVRITRPLGAQGATLAGYLRFSGRGSLMIGRYGEKEVPLKSQWKVTLFHDGPGPVRVAPFVRISTRIPNAKLRAKVWRTLRNTDHRTGIVTGQFVEVPAGRWARDLAWTFDLTETLKDVAQSLKAVPCREIGFVVESKQRGKGSIVIEDFQLTPRPPAHVQAPPKPAPQ